MDRKTLQALEAGDPKSLEWIFEAYGDDCIRRLQRYEHCSPEDAQDIFMDALLLYWQQVRQGKVRHLARSRAYVYAICVHEQKRRYRQQQQAYNAQADLQDQLYEQPFELPLADQQAKEEDDAELTDLVQQALHSLGERCQQVLTYFYVQKLSLTEIAQKLGMADAEVAKTTRYRCYQQWLKHLRRLKKESKD